MTYTPQHVLLAAFLQLSGEQQFVEYVVGFCEREYNIELADVAIVLVHLLDVAMDDFEGNQLIVVGGAAGDEEEGGVSAVDDLGVCSDPSVSKEKKPRVVLSTRYEQTFILKEVAHARAAGQDQLRDILDNLGLVLGGQSGEPFGQALQKGKVLRLLGFELQRCPHAAWSGKWRR